jgi:hypothetical protein
MFGLVLHGNYAAALLSFDTVLQHVAREDRPCALLPVVSCDAMAILPHTAPLTTCSAHNLARKVGSRYAVHSKNGVKRAMKYGATRNSKAVCEAKHGTRVD